MNQTNLETLSALLDNEADDLELRRLFKSWKDLPTDERKALSASWARFNLVQAALHEPVTAVSPRLSERVSAALADEAPLERQAVAGESWPANSQTATGWRELGRMAVAACVALAVFVAMQTGLQPASAPRETVAASADSSAAVAETPAAANLADAGLAEVDPEAQQLLLDYIQGIEIDPAESQGFEHIQNSPLYRLVNELPERP